MPRWKTSSTLQRPNKRSSSSQRNGVNGVNGRAAPPPELPPLHAAVERGVLQNVKQLVKKRYCEFGLLDMRFILLFKPGEKNFLSCAVTNPFGGKGATPGAEGVVCATI